MSPPKLVLFQLRALFSFIDEAEKKFNDKTIMNI